MSEEGDGMTLPEFLLARIAEDEAEVQSLVNDYPSFRERHGWWRNGDDATIELGLGRALAECEAKRRIVQSFAAGEPYPRGSENYATTRMVYRLLALPYADHPDYQEEWRA